MKRIERTEYLNKLIAFKDKSLIKVITGIRRCGKSTIMEIYRGWLKRQGVSADQIIYLNSRITTSMNFVIHITYTLISSH